MNKCDLSKPCLGLGVRNAIWILPVAFALRLIFQAAVFLFGQLQEQECLQNCMHAGQAPRVLGFRHQLPTLSKQTGDQIERSWKPPADEILFRSDSWIAPCINMSTSLISMTVPSNPVRHYRHRIESEIFQAPNLESSWLAFKSRLIQFETLSLDSFPLLA